jgi:hypothetical protein
VIYSAQHAAVEDDDDGCDSEDSTRIIGSVDDEREESSLFFPEQRTRECSSCLVNRLDGEFPRERDWPTCSHEQITTRTECIAQHIDARMDDVGFDKITCPQNDCKAQMTTEQIMLYAEERTLDRYLNWVNKQAVESSEDHLGCASPDCDFSCDIAKASYSWMTSSECHERTCTECETLWHLGFSHEENREAVRRAEEAAAAAERQANDELSTSYIQKAFKACPRCHNQIEKNGGCEHMTCRAPGCRHEFCWVCLADYGPIRRHGNHHHPSNCWLHVGFHQFGRYQVREEILEDIEGAELHVDLSDEDDGHLGDDDDD